MWSSKAMKEMQLSLRKRESISHIWFFVLTHAHGGGGGGGNIVFSLSEPGLVPSTGSFCDVVASVCSAGAEVASAQHVRSMFLSCSLSLMLKLSLLISLSLSRFLGGGGVSHDAHVTESTCRCTYVARVEDPPGA